MIQNVNQTAVIANDGLVLLDRSFNVVGFDRGAASILPNPTQAGVKPNPVAIPQELLNILRNRQASDLASTKLALHVGRLEYTCRIFLLESPGGVFPQPLFALHLERTSSSVDTVHEVAVKFSLTERQVEILYGVSMGLTSKELSNRMKISPNTVKAFLRLIMIKMDVSSRGGIVAKILRPGNGDEPAELEPLGVIGPKGKRKPVNPIYVH